MIKDYTISIKAVKYGKSNQKEVIDFISKNSKVAPSVEPNSPGMPINYGAENPLTIGSWIVLKGKILTVVDDDNYNLYYNK
jgi:hypothetical protein